MTAPYLNPRWQYHPADSHHVDAGLFRQRQQQRAQKAKRARKRSKEQPDARA